MKYTKKQITEFLTESNAIESEYSKEALDDALQAWKTAIIANEPISVDLILAIHRRLMNRLNPKIAGKIRKVDVWVGGKKGMNPELIKDELKELCEIWETYFNIKETVEETGYKKEEVIKDSHIHFEKIHPFLDGNGRTGRILMNLQRMKLGLPILIIKEKEKQEYYKWFRE
ncbi:MAG: DNA phosphorothioation-dependent restriction protein DptG [Nanoarchaeota archaeon]